MKPFKDFLNEAKKKGSKIKNKKSGNVEIMPIINDGKKGMVTKPTNEQFAGNYQGPLYAPHPDIVKEVAPPGKKYERMVKHIKKNYPKDKEGIAYATAWKHKNKKESFEGGVQKARRDYRSGSLMTFKQFMSKLTDILDEWEK